MRQHKVKNRKWMGRTGVWELRSGFRKWALQQNSLPSRSSMVFSSLATDLSANSARVSAWQTHKQRERERENWITSSTHQKTVTQSEHPQTLMILMLNLFSRTRESQLTSFSLSVKILISSSYLSSFWEYCRHIGRKNIMHEQKGKATSPCLSKQLQKYQLQHPFRFLTFRFLAKTLPICNQASHFDTDAVRSAAAGKPEL